MSDCVEWQGCKNEWGYGRMKRGGKMWYAHRRAWFRHYGPIPEGLLVLHHCDNPPCVNIDHLFLGTNADNKADCVAKGRARGGRRKQILGQPQEPSTKDN